MPSSTSVSFWLKKVGFLGHVISGEGIAVDPTKVQSVTEWLASTSVGKIHSFLGLAGYYRLFTEKFPRFETHDRVVEEGHQVQMERGM